jgi:hypothetical protein
VGQDPRQYLNDPEEAIRIALDARQARMWTAMPGIVVSVNPLLLTCVVQLAILGRFEDQNGNVLPTQIPPLQDVPIVFPSAGGFTITLPIAAGDEVLVVFASRCIDSWWQNGGDTNNPMEFRMHDLSDGFCLPGPKSNPQAAKLLLGGVDLTNLQIRSDDGVTFIEITPAGQVAIAAPVGGVSIAGNLSVSGEVTARVATTPVTLSAHHHTGVTTGSGSSGGPVG